MVIVNTVIADAAIVPPPGVSGKRSAARPDRAPDAPPPAAVTTGDTQDRKRRGESDRSGSWLEKYGKLGFPSKFSASFDRQSLQSKSFKHVPQDTEMVYRKDFDQSL